MSVRVQREPFNLQAEIDRMTGGRTDIGALVTFTGLCRSASDGQSVTAMTLETYEAMALAELTRHEQEARRRWALDDATIIHRYGRMEPGDQIVLVITASAHRADAFAAAEFLMDYLKTSAPFWKKEEGGAQANWVAARDSDDTARARWSSPPTD